MGLNIHEEIFINSYARLRGWAAQIVQKDQELAEDLLHDAFIQFTRSQPDLEKINNTDAYLYGVIKNLHLSHLRKKFRREKYAPTIIDFETLRLGLRNAKLLDNYQTQEELKRICYFLCLRKETSKSASVMILRFFHGYFPSEIAEVMQATPQVVKVRLNTARNETKTALENNEIIAAIEKKLPPEIVVKDVFRSNVDLHIAIGEMIFSSTFGKCLTDDELKILYLSDKKEAIETKMLAHIVSCRKCLDKVNDLLGLLPISKRYSVDFIGKDDGGTGNNPGNGSSMKENFDEKVLPIWRCSSREIFEHQPRQLIVSVNGDFEESKRIENESTSIKIKLKFTNEPQFVEIYSEQMLRFASFYLTDLENIETQKFSCDFSDDRKIMLNLIRETDDLLIETIYEDPHFSVQNELITEDKTFDEFLNELKPKLQENEIFGTLLDSKNKQSDSILEKLKNALIPSFIGFKTAFAGGSLAILLIAAIFFTRMFVLVPNISATEIIQKTVAAEQINEDDTERIIHRTFNFEEKNANGEIVKKRRIDFFSDAVRKISVRRLFDENGKLIAGEWRRKDGVSTTYGNGRLSELRLYKTENEFLNGNLENIWQLSVSAKGFETLIGSPENVTVEESNKEYQINFVPTSANVLSKAILHVNRDLRTDKLILIVNQNNATREFSFTETVFEQKPRASVENSVFEPNPEFVKNIKVAGKTVQQTETGEKPLEEIAGKETLPTENAPTATTATSELEVKVLQLLNNVNALSGDQINITKSPNGKIQIKGIVDAKSRKDEIINALAEVRGNSSVSINIQTAEEATKNNASKTPNGTLESISVESKNSIPAGEILRNQFASQGMSEERIESEIRRFSSNALAKSSQIRRSAVQLKQIAERFSPSDIEKMDEATKNNWRKLIKQNAANVAQSAENLRGELRVLNIEAGNGGGNVNSANDADLIRAAKRLFELSLAIDGDVRASFSNSGGSKNVSVKSSKFSTNLGEIIGLARQIK
ncbi:MAG TPA: sigma-70 family RNA polymerase sigma factor [Pyrinomonadaceae bacterium]|nr:sigma-70 family RNA polymerase sigma factor [Pyrinomonadaceae bacterium]